MIAPDPKRTAVAAATPNTTKGLINRIPARYNSPILHLALCVFYGALAGTVGEITSSFTAGIIGSTIVGIVFASCSSRSACWPRPAFSASL